MSQILTAEKTIDTEVLKKYKEFFASGYFEELDASPIIRWSRAVRRRFENRLLTPYNGEILYPSGPSYTGKEDNIIGPSYSFTWFYNESALEQKMTQAEVKEKPTFEFVRNSMRSLESQLNVIKTPHTVGGRGYTHSIPNYGRIIREGLFEYARRIEKNLTTAQHQNNKEKIDFYLGMLDVLAGIKSWHQHILNMLRDSKMDEPDLDERRKRLVSAYEHVPFQPASSFFEAITAYNFVYYLDDCDNPGRIDQELIKYYENDLQSGKITYEDAVKLIRCIWENCDANSGWSSGIGGTTSSGDAGYNELTLACLQAAHKIRRPNLQLHIRKDMPKQVWDAAIDTIATGCGLPALYNDEAFIDALREAHLGIRESDLGLYNGGGCTETMIHGCSNVGSLDAGINLPLILTKTLQNHLAKAENFDDLLKAYKIGVANTIREIVINVNADQEVKSKLRPQPMRSLLIDDCIDNGREFNAGGARYNWSIINVAGLANVIDSLSAIKEVVFDNKEITGAELLEILQSNYKGQESFRKRLERCPRFGNDDPRADEIARDIADFVFREFLVYAPWRGGKFLASCLMFVTYADAGIPVMATPDGRLAGAPLSDSAGPVQGRDRNGPTAMLKSVASLTQKLAPGTLVVNIRFSKNIFGTQAGREKLQDLIRTYFDMGGMQLQINVVDQETLRDAIKNPEKYQDLIIRIGGYSEYFNRLSLELKQTLLERTEHSI